MANRKLMAEVDRTVKKVNEGIENFDELEDKVYSAQSSSQRDKFEGELKKEIKKLQRLRETIRGWISGNEIKDKELLVEKRQQIESRMERFKKCEQKTKMKAYSKEALSKSQVEKRNRNKQNIIPDSKEKKAAKKWLKDIIETLGNAVMDLDEKIEEEEEKEKKKDDDVIEVYRSRQRKHDEYVEKLNQVYEILDNDEGIVPQDLDDLKEYVEYYVEENEDPEFVEDEDSFEAVFKKHREWEESAPKEELVDVDEVKDSIKNLEDEDEDSYGTDDDEDEDSSNLDEDEDEEDLGSPISSSSKEEEKKKPQPVVEKKQPVATATTSKTTAAVVTPPVVVESKKGAKKPTPPAISTTGQATTSSVNTPSTTTPTSATTKPSYSDLVKSPKTPLQPVVTQPSTVKTTIAPTANVTTPTSLTPTTIKKPVSYIDIAQQNKNAQGHNLTVPINETLTSTTSKTTTATATATKPTTSTTTAKQATGKQTKQQPAKKAAATNQTPTTGVSSGTTSPVQTGVPSTSPTTIDKNNDETFSTGSQPQFGLEDLSSQTQTQMQQSLFINQQLQKMQAQQQQQGFSQSIPHSLGNQPFPSYPTSTSPIQPPTSSSFASAPSSNHQYMNEMLQASMKFIPDQYDCNGIHQYIPINENVDFRAEADGFPTESPLSNSMHPLCNPATYAGWDPDVLLFAFYFQQGTYYQYMAAKELKRQAWRYHKKYSTWFQRHDKPTHTTNEFEQGTYVYFDFETGWCQRIKEGFSFEYAYLEDEM